MRVVVLGAGAIGSLLGARLVSAGHDVLLVGRADHVAAIRADGLRILGREPVVVHPRAATRWEPGEPSDACLVTTKTFDLPAALAELGTRPPVPTLLPQNGLGIDRLARSGLRDAGWTEPDRWTVRAVNSIPATLVAPGSVRAAGDGEIVLADAAGAGPAAAATDVLADLLRSGGVWVRRVVDLEAEVWRKAVVNAAINPVTALHGVVNGSVRSDPLRSESLALLREAVATARAESAPLSELQAEEDFDRVSRATAENRSSMLQDLERGRPTEIEAISGELLRRGEARGLSMPATRAAVQAVRERARGRPPQGS